MLRCSGVHVSDWQLVQLATPADSHSCILLEFSSAFIIQHWSFRPFDALRSLVCLSSMVACFCVRCTRKHGPMCTLSDDACRLEHLSWKPRSWLYHNFLTAEEADHIVQLAKPSMERSSVVDADTGKSVLDPVRTSSGTFLA